MATLVHLKTGQIRPLAARVLVGRSGAAALRINDKRVEKNVKDAVARELEAKGFRLAEKDADFYVGYHAIMLDAKPAASAGHTRLGLV